MIGALVNWLRRPSRFSRRLRTMTALLLGVAALVMWLQTASAPGSQGGTKAPNGTAVRQLPASPSSLVKEGGRLFSERCASCHGLNLKGRRGIAPSLAGVGAGPVEFYLSTGRMPLANPHAEPVRSTPVFNRRQIKAIVAYVRARAGGPPSPHANPAAGSLSQGFRLFTENCAGCHSIVARGGITLGAQIPDLTQATPLQVAQAVRTGPYLMPRFGTEQIDQHELDSIARYVVWTHHPYDAGGLGIYNIGPIPEGIVAWFVGLLALVIVARLIGERTEP